jgi:4'-phosphopantetheinyl transferase
VRGFTERRSAPAPLVPSARPHDVLKNVDRGILTVDERRRSAAMHHPADRDTEAVQRCSECGSGGHGKPSMSGLPVVRISLAHTRGAVVAGAAWGPVGVDVESLATHDADTGGMAWALTGAEVGQVQSSGTRAAWARQPT